VPAISRRHEQPRASGAAADAVTAGSKDERCRHPAVERLGLQCRFDQRFSTGTIQRCWGDEKPVGVAVANDEAAALELVQAPRDRLSR
jgi:hypothetical protein